MITGSMLRDSFISAAHAIANQHTAVDELNVFPVPDGDTGTNMSMTIGNAENELAALPDDCAAEKAAAVAASAMLRGARGNSGVILSMLFRGFSKALAGKAAVEADDLRACLARGVEAAYKAVMTPTEGTILTVARRASEEAAKAETDDTVELWNVTVAAAEDALAHTPEQLPILQKAGVVDAGGQGLVIIFRAMGRVFSGGEPVAAGEEDIREEAGPRTQPGKGVFTDFGDDPIADITNAYCTEFLVNKGEGANAERLRAFAESNGNSVVVVEDDDIIKVHIHTGDPGKVLSHALTHGYLTNLKIENMHEQFVKRQAEGTGRRKESDGAGTAEFPYAAVDDDIPFGFVAVAAGEGLVSIFRDLGAGAVVSGGQTMNPSTQDILAAVQSVAARQVFVLPNNKNIIMAAEQAAALADRKVVVLPTRTVPQGMSAMMAFDERADLDGNTIAMNRAAQGVATGQITYAARNSDFDGHKIKKGELLAIEDGKLAFVEERDLTKALTKLTRSMVKKNSSFVTILYGADVTSEAAEKATDAVRAKVPSDVEVIVQAGGQPVYYYIVSVE